MEKELATILKTNNLRLTKPRLRVFETLSSADKPLLMHDIVNQCADIDRVSVYRTLVLFREIQILEIIHVGWKKRYELVAPFKAHHHHLHCGNCGKIVEINSEKLEHFVDDLSQEYGFRIISHTFEVAGLCASCQVE